MSDWQTDWHDVAHWPDWGDSTRAIEIEMADGSVIEGTLFADDVWFNGEDEVPVFRVISGDERYEFVDAVRWRFIDRCLKRE